MAPHDIDVVAIIGVVAAYAVGTFPTAAVVGRRAGFDPTTAGSGNPGASNAFRLGGRGAGAAVLAGDLLKGLVPALVGVAAGGRGWGAAAGTAAVLGHVFPVWRRFRGGKGVATATGMALALWPVPSLAVAGLWVVVAAASRTASVASFTSATALPIAVAVAGAPAWEVTTLVAVAVIVVGRHRANLARLARGQERRLGEGRGGR